MEHTVTPIELIFVLFAVAIGLSYIARRLHIAQREAVIRLRDDGVINDETLRAIERDLDLEALRAGA
ncbi:MAG: hypothetical protein ACSLFN_04210 [Candidatus Limnocylindrales bacterium]